MHFYCENSLKNGVKHTRGWGWKFSKVGTTPPNPPSTRTLPVEVYVVGWRQNPLNTFPRNFLVRRDAANLLRTCYSNMTNYLDKSATSCQQVCCVVVMESRKRRDTTDTTDFFPRQLVTDLLRTCYGETGAMDFGLNCTNRPKTLQHAVYYWQLVARYFYSSTSS